MHTVLSEKLKFRKFVFFNLKYGQHKRFVKKPVITQKYGPSNT